MGSIVEGSGIKHEAAIGRDVQELVRACASARSARDSRQDAGATRYRRSLDIMMSTSIAS